MLKLKKILLILTIALVFVGMMFLIPGILYAVPSVSPASATIEVGIHNNLQHQIFLLVAVQLIGNLLTLE